MMQQDSNHVKLTEEFCFITPSPIVVSLILGFYLVLSTCIVSLFCIPANILDALESCATNFVQAFIIYSGNGSVNVT